MLDGVAPLGAVVGWLLYYFIRKYQLFSPATLAATLGAILGGVALQFLANIASVDTPLGSILNQYSIGVAIGFFAYASYAGIISILFAIGVIKSPMKADFAMGCGGATNAELHHIERVMKFEELVEAWASGTIDDPLLKQQLKIVGIDYREYAEMRLRKYLEISPSVKTFHERQSYFFETAPASA